MKIEMMNDVTGSAIYHLYFQIKIEDTITPTEPKVSANI